MSLKAFHILFIAVSTLLSLGLGGWGLWQFKEAGGLGNLLLGIGSLLGGVALMIYAKAFTRKLKHIGDL